MHQRRIIRNAVADAIKNGETNAGDRVWASREAPADVEELLAEGPIILVYTRREHIKPEDYPASGYDGAVRRCLDIYVEITAVGSDVVDDKLDDLAEQVEAIVDGLSIDGLPATEIRLQETQVDSTQEFQQPVGGALLTFEATYWRDWRTDTSPADKICEAFVNGPDGIIASVALCDDEDCVAKAPA
jgi:hypothetical protein